MPATRDCIYAKISALGSVNEKLLAYLQGLGATSNNLNDAWMEVLVAYSGTIGERKAAFYAAAGASGSSLKDLENDYWCNIYSET